MKTPNIKAEILISLIQQVLYLGGRSLLNLFQEKHFRQTLNWKVKSWKVIVVLPQVFFEISWQILPSKILRNNKQFDYAGFILLLVILCFCRTDLTSTDWHPGFPGKTKSMILAILWARWKFYLEMYRKTQVPPSSAASFYPSFQHDLPELHGTTIQKKNQLQTALSETFPLLFINSNCVVLKDCTSTMKFYLKYSY